MLSAELRSRVMKVPKYQFFCRLCQCAGHGNCPVNPHGGARKTETVPNFSAKNEAFRASIGIGGTIFFEKKKHSQKIGILNWFGKFCKF